MVKVGFIVNPIAGMGGRVGLKGTDGVLEEALRRGATPVAPERAREFLRALRELGVDAFFLAVSRLMGSELLEKEGFDYKVVLNVTSRTTAEDTKKAARIMSSQVDILVFVGGDGTARDVLDVVDQKIPVIGVPAGVKMYSSVFGVNPRACAYLLKCFIEKRCGLKLAEVMDVDEEAYRKGVLSIKLYGYMVTPYEKGIRQESKSIIVSEEEVENKKAIAKYFVENLNGDEILILGPGSTVKAIADELGIDKTLLGIDIVIGRKLVVKDASEKDILRVLEKNPGRKAFIVVSPLGREGFILGRGNQQISPKVIRKIGLSNIVVVATKTKLKETPYLFIDTGDREIDKKIRYVKVLVDYNEYQVVRIHSPPF